MLFLIFFSGMFRRIMNKLDRSTAEKSCNQKFDFHFNRKSKQNSSENNVFFHTERIEKKGIHLRNLKESSRKNSQKKCMIKLF